MLFRPPQRHRKPELEALSNLESFSITPRQPAPGEALYEADWPAETPLPPQNLLVMLHNGDLIAWPRGVSNPQLCLRKCEIIFNA